MPGVKAIGIIAPLTRTDIKSARAVPSIRLRGWREICGTIAATCSLFWQRRARNALAIGGSRTLHTGLAMGTLPVLTGIMFLTGTIRTVSFWLLDAVPVLGAIGRMSRIVN